jgi:nucleoside-diphosphate-sugar epimerase
MKVCVTGANGFVGGALCKYLAKQNYKVIGLVNSNKFIKKKNIKFYNVNFFKKNLNLSNILNNVDCVIHCAAKAHNSYADNISFFSELKKNNIDLTCILAKESKKNKIPKFIFISSIGVNGSNTLKNKAFKSNDKPNPSDPYSISKWKAEKFLKKFFQNSLTKLIIIRPPLIYGPGLKGNLFKLIELINTGWPLPFGNINKLKSFLGLNNLLDFILICIKNPKACNQTFLISDCQDISVSEFIKKLYKSINKKIIFLPMSVLFLNILGFVLNKKKEIKKLITPLQIDSDLSNKMLSWKPKFTIDYEIEKIGKWYLRQNDKIS